MEKLTIPGAPEGLIYPSLQFKWCCGTSEFSGVHSDQTATRMRCSDIIFATIHLEGSERDLFGVLIPRRVKLSSPTEHCISCCSG
jgi:hypothetical protein